MFDKNIDSATPTEELYLSETIKYLLEVKDSWHDRAEIPHRDRVYKEVISRYPDEIPEMQFARGFSAFLDVKKIHIDPHDLLAGFAYRYTYSTTHLIDMPEDYDPLYRPPGGLDSDKEYKACMEVNGFSEDSVEAKELKIFLKGVDVWLYKHWFSGHILPGYERLLKMGLNGLCELGRESVKKHTGREKIVAEAMLMCDEAAVRYVRRYEELARDMAEKEDDADRRANLTRIKEACHKLTIAPPETFFEAIQLLWFAQELLYVESVPSSISIGRMDKYLYPYYEKDKNEGRLTYNEASELLDALWIKYSGTLHSYQAVTVSGTEEDGTTLENDLTYLIFESSRKLMFDQPLLDLRFTDGMSARLWNEVVAQLKTGTGFPGIFYDPICIAAKESTGQTKEDARNYAIIGCVETGLPGEEYTPTELVHLNWPKLFELMFNHGHAIMQDYYAPLFDDKDLESIETFEEFYNWYKSEMEQFLGLSIRAIANIERMIWEKYPTPMLSTFMNGCYEKGMDVTQGATKYNNTGVSTCGLATAVDSLCAIKKVVFEDKLYTLTDFANAIKSNFEGYEELRNIVLNECPKFGNDDDEPDSFMADLIASFSEVCNAQKNPRGGHYMTGLYSVEDHAKAGMCTAATPDGRLAGCYESNSLASVQGMDVNGPTALINSVNKVDLSTVTNGMVLDLKFNPGFLENPKHVQALRHLIDTYFHNGGMEIQFSFVSRETLLAAQADPEKYRNLVVRVSGFSAYFRSLNKVTQDEIIARTEYVEV